MKKHSAMQTKHKLVTVTIPLPVLDDDTVVMFYSVLCNLVDRFDAHYGEQICRFYAQQHTTHTSLPSPNNPDDPPF